MEILYPHALPRCLRHGGDDVGMQRGPAQSSDGSRSVDDRADAEVLLDAHVSKNLAGSKEKSAVFLDNGDESGGDYHAISQRRGFGGAPRWLAIQASVQS